MTDKDFSPEENLLKHIRQNKDGSVQQPVFKDAASQKASKGLSLSWMDGPTVYSERKTLFTFFNWIFILTIVILTGWGGYELTAQTKNIDLIQPEQRLLPPELMTNRIVDGSRSYEYYTQEMGKRDVFESIVKKKERKGPEEKKLAVENPELTKTLKLVGVILGDFPEAVIEDLKTKQTLFLTIGDEVNGAVLDDIKEGRVFLMQHGELIELVQ